MKNIVKILAPQGKWLGSAAKTLDWYKSEALANKGKFDLLVLPELCHTPYFPFEENDAYFDYAISKDSPIIEEWKNLAKLLKCVVVFSFFEKRAKGIYHNSAFVFERDGSVAGFYRKSHIPDDPGFYEKYYFMPGDTGFKVIPTSAGNLGVLICWDQWFPEAARILALQGADILIYPTAIGWDSKEPKKIYARQLDSWVTAMRGHATSNRLFVLAVNRAGKENDLSFWGNSFICAPDGFIIKQLSTERKTMAVAINLSEIEQSRRIWPHFRDRRIDLYYDILNMWID
ncbi:MAG: carbon-nitrogen hydrolase [Fibromonadaceae bacterium]|jgi:N-carbamoylputrescine amidase|nr:carbon-nitrogen hydrolase [Fibromonadaceae bacterium]